MYGQDAAIRLQDRQRLSDIALLDLGFAESHVRALRAAASKSHGIMLITGPTGSGKTTTLYGLLRELASTDRKVITVEDPVEYAMDGVNQIQVNASIGLTFGTTLRNILRHDPDVILVGEIRDHETAEMAFQSALTGHMVLSTLHTNDVPSSFVRLIDMGVEPYLVNAGIVGVSAQRLIRRLYRPGIDDGDGEASRVASEIGYKGRIAVMEFAAMTPELKRLMLQGGDEHRIREALLQSGFLPMRADAQRLIDEGVTDEAEVARVLGAAASVGVED
jgi:type II secretory ATPase GspE/PulE/Tfp pilus assembly ATPase PilB-like protein